MPTVREVDGGIEDQPEREVIFLIVWMAIRLYGWPSEVLCIISGRGKGPSARGKTGDVVIDNVNDRVVRMATA